MRSSESSNAADITSKVLDLVIQEIYKNAESDGITPIEEVFEVLKKRLDPIRDG